MSNKEEVPDFIHSESESQSKKYLWIISVIIMIFWILIYTEIKPGPVFKVVLWSRDSFWILPVMWSRYLDVLLTPAFVCLFVYLFRDMFKAGPISFIIGAILGLSLGTYFSFNYSFFVGIFFSLIIAVLLFPCLLFGVELKLARTFSIALFTGAALAIGVIHGLVMGTIIAFFYLIIAMIKWLLGRTKSV